MIRRIAEATVAFLPLLAACSDTATDGARSSTDARPTPDKSLGATGEPWWEEFTTESGVDFTHESGAVGARELPEIMGAGVAAFDADGDGDLDLLFTNGAFGPGSDREAAGSVTDRFYRQTSPGVFQDDTERSGLGGHGYGMGIAAGDLDNDGDVDLYVTGYGQGALYANRGDGTFVDRTAASGIVNPGWSSSALFFDYDRDGFLDLFVVRYVAFDPDKPCYDRAGRPDYCGPTAFPPATDQLFHNEGDGTFREVSAAAGLSAVAGAGLGVACRDFDGDGWLDLAVANDAYANHLWINQGDGTFEELAFPLGFAFNQHGQAEAGMGIVAGDLDGDLTTDLFLTHLGVETNTVYRGVGERGFQDVTGRSGLAASSMPFTGFGTAALDGDQDGDLDLLVANGRVVRGADSAGDSAWDAYREPNQMFVNEGDGRFREASAREGGAFTEPLEITRGLATGDLDGDGDLDVVVANVQGRARLYRNVFPEPGHWLGVRAVDPQLRRDAIGAAVTLEAGGERWLRTVDGQGGYQSSSSMTVHFGLGGAERYDALRVVWPDGLEESFEGGVVDRVVVVERGGGKQAR